MPNAQRRRKPRTDESDIGRWTLGVERWAFGIVRLSPLLLFVILCNSGLTQEDLGAAAPPAKPHEESVLEVIWGGGWLIRLIWLAIVSTSVVMVTLVIQNFILLRREKLAPTPLYEGLRERIGAGNYQQAWEICNANQSYLANVLKAGLERIGRGKDAVEDALADHSLREAQILRVRNSYLSVIGVVSPMIGLLGTVIGMMGAFAILGTTGIADPRGLSKKIGEVLLATASGLFIAIPAFICYYIFRNRAQDAIVHASDRLNTLVEDIPYSELGGLKIGKQFSAGVAVTDASGSRTVSIALTTHCPKCSAPIKPGQRACAKCGAPLDWKG